MNMTYNKSSKILNLLVCCEIIFFVICAILSMIQNRSKPVDVANIALIISEFLIGVLILAVSMRITHKYFQMFIGMIFLAYSILTTFVIYIIDSDLGKWWPVYGIFSGLFLFVAGLFKYHRVKFGYLFPSIVILGMGLWYSLFSFSIIKFSFRIIAATLGPLFLLLIAVGLILFFLLQQKHKELVITDEETGVFSDEGVSLNTESDD